MELVQRLVRKQLDAQGTRMNYYAATVETLDSQLVVPYTASETEVFAFTAVMRASPYLMAKHTRNGLYGLAQTIAP